MQTQLSMVKDPSLSLDPIHYQNQSVFPYFNTMSYSSERWRKGELFLSPDVREEFHKLFNKMGLGFNLELWLCSGNDPQELNAESLYNLIAKHVNIVMNALCIKTWVP